MTTILDPGTAGTPAVPGVPDGEIVVNAENLGDASADGTLSPIKIVDSLPPNLKAVGISGWRPEGIAIQTPQQVPCELATLSCELAGAALVPYDAIEVRITVDLKPGAHSGEVNEVNVTGGGAKPASLRRPITVSEAPTPYGVEEYSLAQEEEGGAPTTQAGAHPFQQTTRILLNQSRDEAALTHKAEVQPAGLAKDTEFQWPPGLIGNPQAVPTCTISQFLTKVGEEENECPADAAVGVAVVAVNEPAVIGAANITLPLFNLVPAPGEPARFGFNVLVGHAPVVIDTAVRSDGDYGITVSSHNITQTAGFLSATVTVWGVPGDARHDNSRGWGCLYETRGDINPHEPCTPSGQKHPLPFTTMPTSCSAANSTTLLTDPWNGGFLAPITGEFKPEGTLIGCNRVPFSPTIAAEPTSNAATSPTGLNFDIDTNDEGQSNAEGLVQSQLKKAVVALPEGITTNPAVANGLTACSLAQYKAEELGNQSCPESSKVGEVEIESPLVKPVIHGSVYVARQHENPTDNLLTIYMVAKNPELGILVKSAGAVTPNQQTGQLTTTFDELPQLPFSHFHFAFRVGQRAPLITPGLCGKYTTQTDLYPYSNPGSAVHGIADFQVTAGAAGGPCHTSAGQLPNKPTLESGTLTPIAGAYSPFVFKVKREDGSQTLSTISATLPEGLLGKLAGVKECSNAQIAQAEGRGGEGQGALELAQPSCPAASEVGVVNVGTGVGTQPYYVQGKAYLAGPYKGAPLSLAIITPAVVGPFDLGTIVVRTALYVNEFTTQITAKSDPIPTIVHGLPTVVQSISLNMNRPDFTINPTSCEPKQVTGSATSTLGNAAPLQNPFQVGACNALENKPGLKIALNGQTRRVGHPALKAVLTYPKGQNANLRRALVNLPGSEFLDQGNLDKTCTKPVLLAGKCPKTTIYGKAKAWSPLEEAPLSGPVYLVGGFGYKLPALVAELNGQIKVFLVGRIDSGKNKGIRSTFEAVPDAPVSRFVLEMKGGKKYGLLENSQDICKHRQKAIAQFTAQNGKNYDTEPVIQVSCGKKGKKSGGKKK